MKFFLLLLGPLILYAPLYFIVGSIGNQYHSHCYKTAINSLVDNFLINIVLFLIISLFIITLRWAAGKISSGDFTIDKIGLKGHLLTLGILFSATSYFLGVGVSFIPVLIFTGICY